MWRGWRSAVSLLRLEGDKTFVDPLGSEVEMDKAALAVYLDELSFLSRMMHLQAGRPKQAAADWGPAFTSAATSIRRMMAGDRTADTPEYRATLNEALSHQDSVLLAMDGFLAAWARASLMLWPAPIRDAEHKKAAHRRGRLLRAVLHIAKGGHPLEDRELRDAWMHYGERLDDALKDIGPSAVGVEFTSPLLPQPGFVMRAFDLPSLTVTFAGKQRTDLARLFDAAEDLGRRAGGAKYEYYALGGAGLPLPSVSG